MTEQIKEMVYISPLNKKFEIPTIHKCTWRENLGKNASSPHTKKTWTKRDNSTYHENILAVIGNTPLVKLNRIPQDEGLKCNIYAKCEFLNPGGSIKDRIVKRIIEDYEKQGVLKPGMTLIEPTSGNTGIAVAMVAAVKGYKCILVMSEKSSAEKEAIQKSLGATCVRSKAEMPSAPDGPFDTAFRLKQEIRNSIILDQLSNPGNPLAHYDETAEEILSQMNQKVDMLVLPAGTGGTLTGIGRKFREVSPQTKIIGLDIEGSNLAYPPKLNETDVTFFEVEGIGFEMPISTLDQSVCDEWFKTNDLDSFTMARRIIKEEGLLVGASSGASLDAAIKLSKKFNLKEGDNIVIEFTDGVRNYMTKFLSDQWMERKGFLPCKNVHNLWWWEHKISNLELNPPINVNSDDPAGKVLGILRTANKTGAVVLEDYGKILGTVDTQSLTNFLMTGKLQPEQAIKNCVNKNPTILETDSILGRAFRILEKEALILITKKTGQGETKKTTSVFLMEQKDLLEYSLKLKEASKSNGNWTRLCCTKKVSKSF